jgi:hypothetical protein
MPTNQDPKPSLYKTQYEAASQRSAWRRRRRTWGASVRRHKLRCLTPRSSNDSLPPYYIISNWILLVCVSDNWDEGDIWRVCAEQAYTTALERAEDKNDVSSLEVFHDLCGELDEVTKYKKEDMYAWFAEQGMWDAVMDDEMRAPLEDADAAAMAENENDEVAADVTTCGEAGDEEVADDAGLDLPIRWSVELNRGEAQALPYFVRDMLAATPTTASLHVRRKMTEVQTLNTVV